MAAANEQTQNPSLNIISELLAANGGNALAPGLEQFQFNAPGIVSFALCLKALKLHFFGCDRPLFVIFLLGNRTPSTI